MSITRRQFIASLGSTGLIYAFHIPLKGRFQPEQIESMPCEKGTSICSVEFPVDMDYRDWIVFGQGNKVSVFTGRAELGQGLKTVITALVTQSLEITVDDVSVVMGDTDLCPDDGVTSGSSSTMNVGWGFWLACEEIRGNLVKRASQSLRISVNQLEYKNGGVGLKGESTILIKASELGNGQTELITINPKTTVSGRWYGDFRIPNVNAEKIVTGALQFVGDLFEPDQLYAGWLGPPFYPRITRLLSAEMNAARLLPGIKKIDVVHGRVAAIGERYTDVLKALSLVKPKWENPSRSKELNLEEARDKAELLEVKEERGDIDGGFSTSDLVHSETYTTQYITHAQMETDTALAKTDSNGRMLVYANTQHAHMAKKLVAEYLNRPLSDVRVIGMPSGGAFGGRQGNPVNREAAKLSEIVGKPVKLLYSRRDQFHLLGLYKPACSIDITTGATNDGQMLARTVDVYQDWGDGTAETYNIPSLRVKAYRAPNWPAGLVVSRGTSYTQTCFATESHIDMVAHKLGINPFTFRCKNLQYPAFAHLIYACAEMIGYEKNQLDVDEGIGLAIVLHGGCQLGAIAAKVAVNRVSGEVKVKHVCVAFDIGTVINRPMATVGIRGGVAWGISHTLSEEVILNGHGPETVHLSQYRYARFSHMPTINITFLDNHTPGSRPRGCGEMPVIPTMGAIANAIYNAIGVRFYSLPITPEKIKRALGSL